VHWAAPFIGAFIAVLFYGILDTDAKPGEPGAGEVISSDNAPNLQQQQQNSSQQNSGPQFQMNSEDYSVNNENNNNGGNTNGNANFY